MTTGQASLFHSIFSLAHDPPALPHTPESCGSSVIHSQPSTGREKSIYTWRQEASSSHSQPEPTVDLPNSEDDDPEDSEKILVGMLDELVLDREVESNIVPFVAHAFASWISRFAFEPTRTISLARATIIRGHSFGPEIYQKMVSAANAVFSISKSTDYELTYFTIFYQQLVKGALEARACSELTREAAMKAMGSCHELISITSKVASLATVLNLMNLYAPVFRRACPESGDKLVNLPRRLTAAEVTLKYFASYDVLQGLITHRPMFFRYDLNILTPKDDELLDVDDRPGLRWTIGIPDRLMLALARINILVEDYGSSVDKEVVHELATEIERACKPIVTCNPKEDSILMVRRLVVQKVWSLAGYVYLYMGLSGADSNDARVVKVQKQFMRLLETVKPRRNPDVFLTFPIVILGIATSSPVDRSILSARLWGVSECSKPGTVGNDVVRMLNDIWERTTKRPAVWSDLRVACLKITGM
ncbi:hypothetical protein OPQ81_010379 [Rhizoctonia solani]|nr:hypothetical protein OPQ81_010379 [Rhizoctonia solani]